jgi:hypothetical protein
MSSIRPLALSPFTPTERRPTVAQQLISYDRLIEAGFPRLEAPYYYRIEERPELAGIAVQLRRHGRRVGGPADPSVVAEVVLDTRYAREGEVLAELTPLVADMVNRHAVAESLRGDYFPEATEASA